MSPTARRLALAAAALGALLLALWLFWPSAPVEEPPAPPPTPVKAERVRSPSARVRPANTPPTMGTSSTSPEDTGAAAPPRRRATGTVRCAVELPDTPVVALTRVQVAPPDSPGEAVGAIRGGEVVLEVPTGSGSGTLTIDEHGQVEVRWQDVAEGASSACTATLVRTYTALFGTVRGWNPELRGQVTGCGGHGTVEADGSFFATITAEPCAVHVVARHRGRIGHGPEVELDPRGGAETEVTLDAPALAELRPMDDDELEMRRLVVELASQLVDNASADPSFLDQQQAELDAALRARSEEPPLEDDDTGGPSHGLDDGDPPHDVDR